LHPPKKTIKITTAAATSSAATAQADHSRTSETDMLMGAVCCVQLSL
jgi:hypothetical protein